MKHSMMKCIKSGGDYGDKSFKRCYQVANMQKPNSKNNTIVFNIFGAKHIVITASKYSRENLLFIQFDSTLHYRSALLQLYIYI